MKYKEEILGGRIKNYNSKKEEPYKEKSKDRKKKKDFSDARKRKRGEVEYD